MKKKKLWCLINAKKKKKIYWAISSIKPPHPKNTITKFMTSKAMCCNVIDNKIFCIPTISIRHVFNSIVLFLLEKLKSKQDMLT